MRSEYELFLAELLGEATEVCGDASEGPACHALVEITEEDRVRFPVELHEAAAVIITLTDQGFITADTFATAELATEAFEALVEYVEA